MRSGSEHRRRLCLDRNARLAKVGRALVDRFARLLREQLRIVDVLRRFFLLFRHGAARIACYPRSMGAYHGRSRYVVAEQPLSPRDYDVPVGWWGWNWEPPIPMSITEIVRAGNMDTRTAALCGMAIEAH